eukprot:CAMPEP_0181199268 /NCGR_PEP_ID=MMETSP1096-20121128/17082_1 /TAXON_ID=156174 ORGANISM="Chrysochromulina ericina, Strain CCMP281" /NCGR_SAMPLE_ID=MMETSP1096 /ASSEMBLY_ACC=CAM_ASM_000453 /LENGTH=230 /DNA_ID=CAMNT_0023289431 /DNA_START=278 /DNA_END=971 /DNA_ORIENTATION=+
MRWGYVTRVGSPSRPALPPHLSPAGVSNPANKRPPQRWLSQIPAAAAAVRRQGSVADDRIAHRPCSDCRSVCCGRRVIAALLIEDPPQFRNIVFILRFLRERREPLEAQRAARPVDHVSKVRKLHRGRVFGGVVCRSSGALTLLREISRHEGQLSRLIMRNRVEDTVCHRTCALGGYVVYSGENPHKILNLQRPYAAHVQVMEVASSECRSQPHVGQLCTQAHPFLALAG